MGNVSAFLNASDSFVTCTGTSTYCTVASRMHMDMLNWGDCTMPVRTARCDWTAMSVRISAEQAHRVRSC